MENDKCGGQQLMDDYGHEKENREVRPIQRNESLDQEWLGKLEDDRCENRTTQIRSKIAPND